MTAHTFTSLVRDAMSDPEKPSWEWRREVERLTAQLAEVQKRYEDQCAGTKTRLERIQKLERQLAAMTEEREEARDMAACLLFFGPTFPADVAWAEMQIAKMKHEKGLP